MSRSSIYGLSPRVRGNQGILLSTIAAWRSIPACAGEPYLGRAERVAWSVYPRVCGGTLGGTPVVIIKRGLSPRVRGNRPAPHGKPPGRRSIPACAGEPVEGSTGGIWQTVYPRVCGGTLLGVDVEWEHIGLSPRVRGNPRLNGDGPTLRRSIPACAGEPPSPVSNSERHRVYPRVCGGTAQRDRSGGQRRRSIPACAGEPSANALAMSG